MKRDEFENWLFAKTGRSFPSNALFDVCLSSALETFNNSKFNGVPFEDHYPLDVQMKDVLRSFQSRAEALLLSVAPGSAIVFGDVHLGEFSGNRDMLLSQLSQLNVED